MTPRRPEVAGLLWMTLANVLFAIMAITAREASRSASWATIGASRSFVGAMVAVVFALRSGASLRTRSPKLSFARSGFGTLSMVLTFYSLSQAELAVGDAVTLFATAPLFIAILAPIILKEPADKRLWGVLLVAFAGAAMIAGPHFSIGAHAALTAIGSAFFGAMAMMFLRLMRSGRGQQPESSEAIAFHFAMTSFVAHLLLNLVAFRVPTAIDVMFLVLTGVAGGLAQLAMTRAYALAEAARLGATSYVGTVFAFVAAIVVLGERPSWLQIGGALLVVTAGTVLGIVTARSR